MDIITGVIENKDQVNIMDADGQVSRASTAI